MKIILIGLCFTTFFTSSVALTTRLPETNLSNVTTRNQETHSYVAKVVKNGREVCTCVLVKSQVAITTQSCINGQLSDFNVQVLDVRSGKFTSSKIQRIVKLANDKNVVLVELDKKFSKINTPPFSRFSFERKSSCKSLGFSAKGKVKEHKIKSSKKCSGIGKKNFCFEMINKPSACQTSNGSPIVCMYDNKWYLTGLLFIQNGCKKKGITGINLSYLRETLHKAITKMNTDGLCVTSGCTRAAGRLLEKMDTDVDPCDNFYDFACGNWLKLTPIPEDFPDSSILYEITDDNRMLVRSLLEEGPLSDDIEAVVKAKKLYKACMNTDKIEELGIAPILTYMESLGGLPLLGDRPGGGWDAKKYSLEDLTIKTYPRTSLVHISVYDTREYPEPLYMTIDRPNLNPNFKPNDSKFLKAYTTYLEEVFQFFGANKKKASAYAKDIVALEVDIEKNIVKSGTEQGYYLIGVGDVKKVVKTKIELRKIVKGIYEGGGVSIDKMEKVVVPLRSVTYFSRLDDIVKKYPADVIASYIVSKAALSHEAFLPKIFVDSYNKFKQEVDMTPKVRSRWSSCISLMGTEMPYVTGRIFVDEAFLEFEKVYMLELAKRHKNVFTRMLEKQSWISKEVKNKLIEKAVAMKIEAGYPDLVTNDTALNNIHKHWIAYIDDPYRTIVSFTDAEKFQTVELLTEKNDANPWKYTPAIANAFYNVGLNTVILYAGYLQPMSYSHDMPEYLNHAGIGFITGHEISHSFGPITRLVTKDGYFNITWPSKDDKKYMRREQCLKDQYAKFTVPGTNGVKLNSAITSREDVADNGGIKISYKTYRDWVRTTRNGKEENRLPGLPYTPDQLFFVNFAQTFCSKVKKMYVKQWIETKVHTLGRFRVIGSIQNSDDFSKTWNCPIGSNMNPPEKCSILD